MTISLKYLDTGAMITLSTTLLGKNGIGAVKQAKGLTDDLREAHDALVAAKPQGDKPPSVALSGLVDAALAKDRQHDHALRAVHYLLLAAEEFARAADAPDEEHAGALAAARAALVPTGLEGTSFAYATEAGNAALAKAKLASDAAIGAALDGVALAKKTTGRDVVALYVLRGEELGAAVKAKTETAREEASAVTPATMLAARNQWARTVNTVARTLAHAKGEGAAGLLAAITDAAATARERALRARKPKASDPPPAEPST